MIRTAKARQIDHSSDCPSHELVEQRRKKIRAGWSAAERCHRAEQATEEVLALWAVIKGFGKPERLATRSS